MSTDWRPDRGDGEAPIDGRRALDRAPADIVRERIEIVRAPGLPPPDHPAEADAFARHEGVPGHDQGALEDARVLIVGAGGLGSWAAVAFARSGVRTLAIADHDVFDRTNASRQLMFGDDLRQPKAIALARNVAPHVVAGGTVTGMAMPFDAAVRYAIPADLLVTLVDNNACRLQASRFARARGIPAVFSMLSADSMRMHTFLQGAGEGDACLWCAAPNLEPDALAPCASAVIAGCLASAAHVTFFAYRALMGWPAGAVTFNWRASDLTGQAPEEIGVVRRRIDCAVCGEA